MALSRIKTVEKLRGQAPGEFGKILGLDRVPEVRCLRKKMDELSADNAAELWAAHLGRHWMQADTEAAGTLYVDGHVLSLSRAADQAAQAICFKGKAVPAGDYRLLGKRCRWSPVFLCGESDRSWIAQNLARRHRTTVTQ